MYCTILKYFSGLKLYYRCFRATQIKQPAFIKILLCVTVGLKYLQKQCTMHIFKYQIAMTLFC